MSILLVIFFLSGGLDSLGIFKEGLEGGGNYAVYNNTPLFTRNQNKPLRVKPPNMYNLGASNMMPNTSFVRP